MTEVVVICGETLRDCKCLEPYGHYELDGSMHKCDCGGSWVFDDIGDFQLGTLPDIFRVYDDEESW